jgi:hypothetical protein
VTLGGQEPEGGQASFRVDRRALYARTRVEWRSPRGARVPGWGTIELLAAERENVVMKLESVLTAFLLAVVFVAGGSGQTCPGDATIDSIGEGTLASMGVPELVAQGVPIGGLPFELRVEGARPDAHGQLLVI